MDGDDVVTLGSVVGVVVLGTISTADPTMCVVAAAGLGGYRVRSRAR